MATRRLGGLKVKKAQGTVTKYSVRVIQSDRLAHSFFLSQEKFTLFPDNELLPIIDGDIVNFDYEIRHLRKSKYRSKYFSVIPDSLIVAAPTEIQSEVEGHVYILSNASMPSLLKVGFTTGKVTKRASELSDMTSVPTAFKIEWSHPVTGNARAKLVPF